MCMKHVAVVGGGIMGADLALDLSICGYTVTLNDLNEEKLQAAKQNIESSFRMIRLMRKDVAGLHIEKILDNIQFNVDYKGFEKAGLVIENITEDWSEKKKVYEKLQTVCSPETIYAVNTSCISITKVGACMPYPQKVIGMHFMNPVPLKELVEVIKGQYTSEETIQAAKSFLKSMNKKPVIVNDFPGFVTNRILMLTINESIWTVQDQVAAPADVDKIFRTGFGHKMGPLATGDLIGLDTILNSLLVLYESYKDPKFRPCPLLVKMVDAGQLGRKSGKGFFDYSR